MTRRSLAHAIAMAAACGSGGAHSQAAEPDLHEGDPFERAIESADQDVFSPRLLPGPKRATDRAPIAEGDATPGVLQSGDLAAWPRLYHDGGLLVTGSVSGTVAVFKMWNNQFASTPQVLPKGVIANPGWGEFFLEAGLTAKYAFDAATSVYGSFSYLESGTRGHDYATDGNTYHGLPELLYGGTTLQAGDGATLDLSYGQQEFTVGNGMLLWSGATNGTQRGADYLGPRTAWAIAALGKLKWGDLAVQGFYLKPNEAQADDTGTRIAGVNADWMPPGPMRLGAMYVHVPRSQIVTRDGLDVYDVRVRWHPLWASPQFWLNGEYAWERNAAMRAEGWYAQANYNVKDWPWAPHFALQWTSLSGDEPGSAKWEGFDPLYFGNGNPNWYQGKLGSTLFNNTNLQTASLTATLNPSASDILELWYLYFRAAVANSPLEIPSAGEPPPTGGVPSRPLANEFDCSWTHTFNKSVNVNVIAAYAAPGSGYKQLYEGMGGSATGWWFLGTQLNVSY
ncbi:MAG TPA: alginate export family protein [Casimicrobiaceae bacterium]|nr:alginate export family protein [Casimicrobiaceae bacterium]